MSVSVSSPAQLCEHAFGIACLCCANRVALLSCLAVHSIAHSARMAAGAGQQLVPCTSVEAKGTA